MSQPGLAERLAALPPSATIAMTARARALRAEGHRVISLSIGEPDFASPPQAVAAAHEAALAGVTKYPPVDGLPRLKSAIQAKFSRENGLDYALDEITVANGGKQVIYNAFSATLDPGDEVVVPAPYWVSYPLTAQLLGGVPVVVPTEAARGFQLDPAALAAAITPRTKWVVLNFPNNPTGAVCPPEAMRAIGEVLARHPHVWAMSDEIYEHLIHDGTPHASIAALCPALKDRVLTLNGVSKAYAMTGWRVGYAGGPKRLIVAMNKMQGHATSGVAGPCQWAAAAALDGPQESVAEMRVVYGRRRDRVVAALRAMPGIGCAMPGGAFYAYPSVAGCIGRRSARGRAIGSDEDFALALLDEAHVAVVQGAAFGMSPYVRLSYATDDAALDEACARMHAFCAAMTGGTK